MGDKSFVVGSFRDVWYYDLGSNTWTQAHDGTGTAPPTSFSYIAGIGPSNNAVYMMGGSMSPDELWEWDIASGTWTQVDDGTGTVKSEQYPGKRGMGGVSLNPFRLYYFVGENDPMVSDIWYYSLSSTVTTSTTTYTMTTTVTTVTTQTATTTSLFQPQCYEKLNLLTHDFSFPRKEHLCNPVHDVQIQKTYCKHTHSNLVILALLREVPIQSGQFVLYNGYKYRMLDGTYPNAARYRAAGLLAANAGWLGGCWLGA